MTPGRALSIAALCFVALAPPSLAEGGRFYGMLRSRDLTPFGFLRLDMRPAHAVNIETHTFAFEAELGYQNTWALSENVEKYLTSLEPSGRREIGPAEIQAIRDLPGENYLLDLESATLDMAVHYKISSQWTAYLFATAVSYQGGFLDSTHRRIPRLRSASAPSAGRAIARNGTNLIYDLKSRQAVLLDAPPESRIPGSDFRRCVTPASHCRGAGRCRLRPR